MKGKKRVFAALLSVLLVFSMVMGTTTTAFAANRNEQFTVTYVDAIDGHKMDTETVTANHYDYYDGYYGLTKGTKKSTEKEDSNGYSYTFQGWSRYKTGYSNYIYETSDGFGITKNTTIYARYSQTQIKGYTVTFKYGNKSSKQTVAKGGHPTAPDASVAFDDTSSRQTTIDTITGWKLNGDSKVYTNDQVNAMTINKDTTFTAVLESQKIAFFFVRTDGIEPVENGSTGYDVGEYTPYEGDGSKLVYRAVKEQKRIYGPIANKATEDNIANIMKDSLPKVSDFPTLKGTASDETHYIRWYVMKEIGSGTATGWHIDGILRKEPTIKFVDYDGSVIEAQHSIKHDTKITAPDDPSRAGSATKTYEFKGWKVDNWEKGMDFDENKVYTKAELAEKVIEKDMVFKAVYDETTYVKYTFVDEKGNKIAGYSDVKVAKGSLVSNVAPDQKGSEDNTKVVEFAGWAVKGTTTKVDFKTYKVEKDTTFAPLFKTTEKFVVRFFKTVNEQIGQTQYIVKNAKAICEDDPSIVDTEDTKYNFKGWKKNNAGAVIDKNTINGTPVTANTDYVASFEISYRVQFKDGDDVKGTSWVVEGNKVPKANVPTTSREGSDKVVYTFKGWKLGNKIYQTASDVAKVNITGPTTFEAQYDVTNYYYVNFVDEDGKTKLADQQTIQAGSKSFTVPGTPTKAADDDYTYEFAGWTVNGKDVDVKDYTINADTVFKAKYNKTAKLKVKFFNEETQVGPTYKVVANTDKVTAPADNDITKADKDGVRYTFAGWQIDGTGTVYNKAEIDNKTFTTDTNFYAVFNESYLVKFKNEGVTVAESYINKNEAVAEKDVPTVSKESTERIDYTFRAWKNGKNEYADAAAVATVAITAPTTFEAQYDKTEYVFVRFVKTDGTTDIVDAQKVVKGTGTVTAPANQSRETADGIKYDFAGWKIENIGTAYSKTAVEAKTFVADTTIYEAYNHSYLVTFMNGTTVLGTPEYVPENEYVTSVPTATKEDTQSTHYEFKDWVVGNTPKHLTTEAVKITPIQAPVIYNACFDETSKFLVQFFDFSENLISEFTQYIISGATATAPDDLSIKETDTAKYEFLGWKDGKTGEAKGKEDVESLVITQNHNFYADFKVTPKYAVDFKDAQGAVGDVAHILKGEKVTTVPTAREKAADTYNTYEFDYWTIEGDTTGKQYKDAAAVKDYVVNKDTTFVANYKATAKLSVKFFDGQDQVGNTQYVVANQDNVVTPDDRSKDTADGIKYTFAGWTMNDGKDVFKADAINAMTFATDTNFYAVYNEAYLVTFKNEGTTLGTPEYVDAGKTVSTVPTATKANTKYYDYSFRGWKTGDDEYKSAKVATMPITAPTTFEAQFKSTRFVFVNFKDADDTPLGEQDQRVKAGTAGYTAPDEPTKAADDDYVYSFAGWTVSGEKVDLTDYTVNTDTTFVASYDATAKVQVRFFNGTTQIGTTQKLVPNTKATVPADPTKATAAGIKYSFIGWQIDGEGTVYTVNQVKDMAFTANTDFYAAYAESYLVTFKNGDDTLWSDYVANGTNVPSVPTATKEDTDYVHYTFNNWLVEGTQAAYTSDEVAELPITAPIVFTANFDETSKFMVRFFDYSKNLIEGFTQFVISGSKVEKAPADQAIAETDTAKYEFLGWKTGTNTPISKEEVLALAITGNTDFYADFKVTPKYAVTFEDVVGQIGDAAHILEGEKVTDVPTARDKAEDQKNTYVFDYWTIKDDTTETHYADADAVKAKAITEDTVFVANYKAIPKLQVKFFNLDDTDQIGDTNYVVANRDKVVTPDAQTKPEDYEKYNYKFAGWQIDGTGEVLSKETIDDMTFTKDTNFFAAYNVEYYVQFVNEGVLLQAKYIPEGGIYDYVPEATKAREAKKEFAFKDWISDDGTYSSEEAGALKIYAPKRFDAEYTTINYYDVTFVNGDEELLNNLVKENTNVPETPEETPKKEETETEVFEFEGWVVKDGDDTVYTNEEVLGFVVTGDTVFEASFTPIRKVVVQFFDYNGAVLAKQVFAPGGNAVAPADPTREGTEEVSYDFAGWLMYNEGNALTAAQINALTFEEDTEFYATYDETEVLPGVFVNPDLDNGGNGNNGEEGEVLGASFSKTGDVTPITALVVILALSSMTIAGIAFRKKENDR